MITKETFTKQKSDTEILLLLSKSIITKKIVNNFHRIQTIHVRTST